MANTLKSWMILNNATADIPAAGTTGAHDFDTTIFRPFYDDGANKIPWRANITVPMISPTGTAMTITTGAAYAPWIGNASLFMDFSRFRQARLTMWASVQIGSTNATFKIVDTTNTQDMTGTVNVNSTTAARYTTSWGNLNSATYAGDAQFELEALQGVAADVIKIFSAQLELR